MPLESFRGSAIAPLLAQAQAKIGPEAVVLRVDQVRLADGRVLLELVAGDPPSVAAERRRAELEKRGTQAPEAVPAPAVLAHRRGPGADVIAVVGPTGAGKTTTVAKLACHPRVFAGRKVGIVCLDTYRVGAVEQLRTYAELVARPLAVVYDDADLEAALAELVACDVLIVDCPGRGPRSQADAETVSRWLRRLGPHETHLVLPAGLQPELARRMIEQQRRLGATHLVASKVDEYPDDWSLFDLAAELGMPMRWIADGQRVPHDLRSAATRLEAAQAARRARSGRVAARRPLERTA